MTDNGPDEKKLIERKHDFMGYKFCPRCSNRLEKRFIDHKDRMECINETCDYIYYHNPIPAAGAIVITDGKVLLVKRCGNPQSRLVVPSGRVYGMVGASVSNGGSRIERRNRTGSAAHGIIRRLFRGR